MRLILALMLPLLTTACGTDGTPEDTGPDCSAPAPSSIVAEVRDINAAPLALAMLSYTVDSGEPKNASCTEGLSPCSSWDIVFETPARQLYIVDIEMHPNDGGTVGTVRLAMDLSDEEPNSCGFVSRSIVQSITYAP